MKWRIIGFGLRRDVFKLELFMYYILKKVFSDIFVFRVICVIMYDKGIILYIGICYLGFGICYLFFE